jgi:hypothetical protein
MRRWDLSKWEKMRVSPRMVGRVQRILELREIQEQLQSQLYDVFELMREQNLSEEEQRAVGGIWLNRLRDQL